MYKLLTIAIISACIPRISSAQNHDLRLELHGAEQRMLEKNIPLLLQKYQVDAAKAEVITAKLYDNPTISYENVIYNSTNHRWFDLSYGGQNALEIQQVINLAGQRNKAIQLAKQGVKLDEYQFYDLLRSLKYELQDDFYNIYYLQQSLQLFQEQVNSLQTFLQALQREQKNGNVSAKEVMRMQALYYDLLSERNDIQQELQVQRGNVNLLLRIPADSDFIAEVPRKNIMNIQPSGYSYIQLLDTANNNRADLNLAKANEKYQELNVRLQQSLAVPQLTVGFSYDKQGNFMRNYTGLSLGIPIPIFNRNQGNIKLAKTALKSSELATQSVTDQLQQDVMNSYRQAILAKQLLDEVDVHFPDQFNQLVRNVQEQFRLRNISILEFVDMYDAYRSSILKLHQLQYQFAQSLAKINYTTGTDIISLD